MQYKIIKRIISGIETIGYILIDEDGNEKQLKESDIIILCRNDMISNAKVILDSDECKYELYISNDDIENVTKESKHRNLKLIGRIVNDDLSTKGYIVKDEVGKTYKLSKLKFWDMVNNNSVPGLRACIAGNKKVLLSSESVKLSDIPNIEDTK